MLTAPEATVRNQHNEREVKRIKLGIHLAVYFVNNKLKILTPLITEDRVSPL